MRINKKYLWILWCGFLFCFVDFLHSEKLPADLSLTAGIQPKNYLLGKFDPGSYPAYFTRLPSSLADKEIYLRKEALTALLAMSRAMAKENLSIRVISGFRSFGSQKSIWEDKYQKKFAASHPDPANRVVAILNYSAMPGTSRHHWGTDVDLNSLDNDFFEKGEGKRLYHWLQKNGPAFGFVQVYTAGRTDGYKEEKWHYSFLPLAKPLLSLYLREVGLPDISGFSGDRFTREISVITNYVKGVNPKVF